MRILFVCLGNICRSPTAEAVARARIPGVGFDSAGTSGWHIGDPPYGPMQAAAARRGVVMADLRARAFAASDFAAFDLILGMDDQNLADIEAQRPDGASCPVRLLTDFAESPENGVPDPYYTRDFDGALDLIEACVDGLAKWVDGHSAGDAPPDSIRR